MTLSATGAPLRIALFFELPGSDRWVQALQAALPQAQVTVWPEVDPQADVAVAWSPSQAFVDAHPQLRYLFNMGAGVDALLRLQLPPSLQLVRIEDGGMAEQMADYVCHAVLRHFREFDRYAESAAQAQWQPRAPRRREDFPIGIMGLGVLGGHVARALQPFGFPLRGWSQAAKTIDGVQPFAGQDQLPAFLQATRILVCMLPLTPATADILNRDTLSQLQRGAYLINVARGGHLVEQDLLDVLAQGQLAGAMLDVTREEPLPPEHPFWRQPGITITPHISAQTLREQGVAQIAAKLQAIADGAQPSGLVDRNQGY